MKFNPIRQLFKYDGNVTIKVMHAINPSIYHAERLHGQFTA